MGYVVRATNYRREMDRVDKYMDPEMVYPSPGSKGVATAATQDPASRMPWFLIAWFLGLLILLFFPVLKVMVKEWVVDEDMGHAFFVPVVSGYIVWINRQKILSKPVKPFWPAVLLVIWGFCQMLLGFLGADFFVARTAFLIAVVGVIWTIAGTAVLRALAFPLFLLLFMIRIPLFIYQQITFPLQIFASQVAAFSLQLIGIPVLRDGNILELASQRLEVVEACSGIRSLLSLSFLSLAYAQFFDERTWMKPVLFVATIPIAIVANASRVTIAGILSEYKKEWAEGVYHTFEGWVIFMVAFLILIATHRLICRFTRQPHA
jgi:exosortase